MPTLSILTSPEDVPGTFLVAGTRSSNGLTSLFRLFKWTLPLVISKIFHASWMDGKQKAPLLLLFPWHYIRYIITGWLGRRRYESADILLDLRNQRVPSRHENTPGQSASWKIFSPWALCQGCISTFHGGKPLNKLSRMQARKGNPSMEATETNEDHTRCLFLTREACNELRERGCFVEDTLFFQHAHWRGVG